MPGGGDIIFPVHASTPSLRVNHRHLSHVAAGVACQQRAQRVGATCPCALVPTRACRSWGLQTTAVATAPTPRLGPGHYRPDRTTNATAPPRPARRLPDRAPRWKTLYGSHGRGEFLREFVLCGLFSCGFELLRIQTRQRSSSLAGKQKLNASGGLQFVFEWTRPNAHETNG